MRSLARLIDGAGCSEQSRSCLEDMRGTVPRDRSLLLLPRPPPWPRAPPRPPDEYLLEGLSAPLRTLWIHDYRPSAPPLEPLLWTATKRTLRPVRAHVLDSEVIPTLLAICLHGSHDPCCGTRGGKLLRRLLSLRPTLPVVGTTHLGGDRFAANVLFLPDGYLLGRLDDCPDAALEKLVDDHILPAGHVRGRLGISPAEAAAEIWFREQHNQWNAREYVMTSTLASEPSGHQPMHWRVEVGVAGRVTVLDLVLREDRSKQLRYTCASEGRDALYAWEIIPAG